MDSRCPVYVREGFSMIDELVSEGASGELLCMDICSVWQGRAES